MPNCSHSLQQLQATAMELWGTAHQDRAARWMRLNFCLAALDAWWMGDDEISQNGGALLVAGGRRAMDEIWNLQV
jgi:hypothetical protein